MPRSYHCSWECQSSIQRVISPGEHGSADLYSQHKGTLSSVCDFLKNLLTFGLFRSKENDPFTHNYHFKNVLKVTFTPSAAVAVGEHSS